MSHYNINKLTREYKTFCKDFDAHIVNFKSIGVMKQKKFVLDQLFNDLENHSRIHPNQHKNKVNNARVCLEELHIDLLKGMLNDGFFTK